MQITLTDDGHEALQRMVTDWIAQSTPEQITLAVAEACVSLGVTPTVDLFNAFPPMRPNVG